MQDKYTTFCRKDQAVTVYFSAENISSDGIVVLLEKISWPVIWASQPTLSRFEDRIGLRTAFSIGYEWRECYAESLKGRDKII